MKKLKIKDTKKTPTDEELWNASRIELFVDDILVMGTTVLKMPKTQKDIAKILMEMVDMMDSPQFLDEEVLGKYASKNIL